ncbi:MAG: D-alanyl-D-alanine carboxypeptidase/D-alanyl-D-alanine-endopeptidase [Gemmatimonadales bacterium]
MPVRTLVLFALFAFCTPLAAQRGLAGRVDRVLDQAPFDRANWGVVLMDTAGRVLYQRNADRLFIPASSTKLIVSATAAALFPPDFTATTDVYGTGPIVQGVLEGALVIHGAGDPTFGARCYAVDTLALGACEWMWSRMGALADSIAARGIRTVNGAIVGDGSAFESRQIHPVWEVADLTWWYASPVSALGFNDNSVNVRYGPSRVGAPPVVTFAPDLGHFRFENRAVTGAATDTMTFALWRDDAAHLIVAEGVMPVDSAFRTRYVAMPDPDLYFALALRAALAERGVAVRGPTLSTTDPARYAACRTICPPLVRFPSRPVRDWIFPILNTSQNWYAEMVLKHLGAGMRGAGSWRDGLAVERRFLIDSVGIDSTAFDLSDGSGLSTGNLVTPRAFAQLLTYMWRHQNRDAFLAGIPRSGAVGSLRSRFLGTPMEGRVLGKPGYISHVNTLTGYIERERGGPLVYSVMVNNRVAGYAQALAQIDSVVVELGR